MRFAAWSAGFALSLCLAGAALSAPMADGPKLPKNGHESADAAVEDEPAYIMDVGGKRVRLVGPRFYTNSEQPMKFPGRADPGSQP